MANLRRLGVHSRFAIRLRVHPRTSRHHKVSVRHHTYRRYSGVGGGAMNFHSAKARAKNHARLSAKAKAKAAARTALLRSPAHRTLLRQQARAAALQKANTRTAQLRAKGASKKPPRATSPKRAKTRPTGAPISAANYLNMF